MRRLSLGFLIAASSGCLRPEMFVDRDAGVIAVLPADNESMNLSADPVVRSAVAAVLRRKGYRLAEPARVTAALKRHAISDGGQLRAVDARSLARDIGANSLIYSVVHNFAMTPGYPLVPAAEVSLRMVDGRTGETFWTGAAKDTKAVAGVFSEEESKRWIDGVGAEINGPFEAMTAIRAFVAVDTAMASLPGY